MDDLIDQIAGKTGLDSAVTRRALGIIINFLGREAPPEQAQGLIDKMPGARALADEYGTASGGLMGVFNDLTAAGLSMSEMQSVTREFIAAAKVRIGEREVDQVIRSIPGLGQFV